MPSLPEMPAVTYHTFEKRYCYRDVYTGRRVCNGWSNGARIGTGIGVAIAVLIICLLLGCGFRRRRRVGSSTQPAFQTQQQMPYYQGQQNQQGAYGQGGNNQGYAGYQGYQNTGDNTGYNQNNNYQPGGFYAPQGNNPVGQEQYGYPPRDGGDATSPSGQYAPPSGPPPGSKGAEDIAVPPPAYTDNGGKRV